MQNHVEMFSFSSNLWYEPRRVNKITREASMYLQVVIDGKHTAFPLKLRWPIDKIDKASDILLPRFNKDKAAYDFNLIIKQLFFLDR